MSDHEPTELWFPITDLQPLVEHCMARDVQNDPDYGQQPVLHLVAQGRLFYLTTNAYPPLLVDAFDPSSVQRVYAIGYSYHFGATSLPADQRHGAAQRLGSLPLITGHRDSILGQLYDRIRREAWTEGRCLVITLDGEGVLRWDVQPLPHPAPAAAWRDTELEIFGLPGSWPGQTPTNGTWNGFLLPRFAPDVARQLADTLAQARQLPGPVTPVELTTEPDAGDPHRIGLDWDGFYRIGHGWPWVSLDLLPAGQLLPYLHPPQPGTDPTELPAFGQDTYTGMGALMWLDDAGQLLLRTIDGTGHDDRQWVGRPDYGALNPAMESQYRAVEHALRLAGAARATVSVSGLTDRFTPSEIEALVVIAARAVCVGVDTLEASQVDLARRAFAVTNRDRAETQTPR